MTPWKFLLSLAAAGLPLSSGAQPQLVEVPLPVGQALVRELVAPPRDFIELCSRLKGGRLLAWAFEAAEPLAFTTHVHADGGVKDAETMSALTAAKGRLVLNGDHVYCWVWSNPSGMAVTIRVRLSP